MSARSGLLLAAALLIAALAWLLGQALGPTATTTPGGMRASSAQDEFPRDVEVPGGSVRIPARPRRVVASSARGIDLVAALVAPERIAGFPEQALEYATAGAADPRLGSAARFPAYLAESVLALAPDLVVADPWGAPDTNARLREAGVPVLVLPDVVRWEDARDVLLLLGRALGEEARAAEVVAGYAVRVQALRERARGRPRLRALAYSSFGAQGFTAGAGTTIDTLLELAGMENAAGDRNGHGTIGFEQLIALDPDVIIVSEPLNIPAGPAGDRGGSSARVLRTEPALASLRAVREERILALPAGLYASASHTIVDGAEHLARELERLQAAQAGGAR